MFRKNKFPSGAVTPPYIPPMTLPPLDITYAKSKRIKTIVKHCTQSKEFDAEVNDLIKDGWHLDEVRTTNSESLIMLFALLYRYEPAEEQAEKIGKWLKTDAYPHHVYCSECYKTYVTNEEVIQGKGWGTVYCTEAEFCPHCGVRMVTEQEGK